MLEQFADRHPEALILAFGIAVLLVIIAIAWALDVFFDAAEPERAPVTPSQPALPPIDRAVLMAAHTDVVRRHAELLARDAPGVFLVFTLGRLPGRPGVCRTLVGVYRKWQLAVDSAQATAAHRGWRIPELDGAWWQHESHPDEWFFDHIVIQRAASKANVVDIRQKIDRFYASARRLEALSTRSGSR
jgi:hypothetical protein